MSKVLLGLVLFLCDFVSAFLDFQKNTCTKYHEYAFKEISENCRVNENVMVTTPTLIERYGFKSGTYTVTTDDGYILTIFRMLPKKDGDNQKTPVILAHGLGVDSGSWLIPDGNASIGFSLANAGYDVWLMNFRGTRYSRRHTRMTSDDPEYWRYTLDTLAGNDIQNVILEVAEITRKKILFVGHSRATTLIFMWASENSKLAEVLLAGVVSLVPVAYFEPRPQVKIIMDRGSQLFKYMMDVNIVVLFYDYELILKTTHYVCPRFPYLCNFLFNYFMGFSSHLRPDDFLLTWSQTPLTTETSTLLQYCQNYVAGRLQKFDYGKEENLNKYGRIEPPEYGLANVTVPVYLMSIRRDSITSDEVIRKVYNELGSKEKFWSVIPESDFREENQFNHADVLWGENAPKLVTPKILWILNYFKKYVIEL